MTIPHIFQVKAKVLMETFVPSQYSYYPLVWMSHSPWLNKCINSLNERAYRLVHQDWVSFFTKRLKKEKSITIHERNTQTTGNKKLAVI